MATDNDGGLEIVDAGEMYPVRPFTSDDGESSIPFTLLSGEDLLFRGRSSNGILVVTSYRLYCKEECINIPIGLIDVVEVGEIQHMYIYSKDGSFHKCSFDSVDEVQKWFKRIADTIKLAENIDSCFAFRFLTWSRFLNRDLLMAQPVADLNNMDLETIPDEAVRMGFDLKTVWRISDANVEYALCPSYPRHLIVPISISDAFMVECSSFRYSKRLPAVVWRHQQNGCVIARSSQPKMGILSWRSFSDETLIESIAAAASIDTGFQNDVVGDQSESSDNQIMVSRPKKKLLIIDARSYAAAITNRAKGGGYECDKYYPNCEVEFMNLANIHAIRSSFWALKYLCSAPNENNWLSSLEGTQWLLNISGIIRSALVVVNAIDKDERSVLVHCSDGWDRTPQIVSLAQIMMDPYYRTKKGFKVLVEKEWLEFGHKFGDRCGNPGGKQDSCERCPVFLQWLDCLYQLQNQFPCHFEFNQQYLIRLVLHTYSNLFGTFFCNTDQERRSFSLSRRTFSVWPILNEREQFHNYLYQGSTEILYPSFQLRHLKFWSELYIPFHTSNLERQALQIPDEEPPLVEEPANLVRGGNIPQPPEVQGDDIPQPPVQGDDNDPSPDENVVVAPPPEPRDLMTFEPEASIHACSGNCLDPRCPNYRDNLNRTASSSGAGSSALPREPGITSSTDTLVGESGAIALQQVPSEPEVEQGTVRTASTDTRDLPLLEDIMLSLDVDPERGVPAWFNLFGPGYQNRASADSPGFSYATPADSRTPSSGFPATPIDDPSGGDVLNRAASSAGQVMEFDGLNIQLDPIQHRIRRLILHYKNKVGNLHWDLSAARCEYVRLMCRLYQVKENRRSNGEDAFHAGHLNTVYG